MEIILTALLLGIILVSWFLLYRDFVVKSELRDSIKRLVNMQEVFISKLDRLVIELHDLPYGFKRACDASHKEIAREVLRGLTLRDGGLRKDILDQIINKIAKGKAEKK